jgi:hypothetical protein
MTDTSRSSPDLSQSMNSEIDAAELAQMKQLLRGALDETPDQTPDVLRGVQLKLHERSGGKFYADGWSTARHPPISTFLVTSLMMLAFIVFIYFVLHPLAGKPSMVRSVPVPVQVIAPRSASSH